MLMTVNLLAIYSANNWRLADQGKGVKLKAISKEKSTYEDVRM
jgi:hypothetical protein